MRAVAATASERQESERTENERDHRESQPALKPKLDEPRKMMVEMMVVTRRVCESTSMKQKRQV